MASCTICGVAFEKSEQVRAHIQGSGGEHAGIGFADAKDYISEARDEASPPTDSATDSASEPAEESLSNEGGVGVPQHAQTTPDEQSTEPECPECGGNRWFDASQHTEYSFGCADCSDSDSWVVFDQ